MSGSMYRWFRCIIPTIITRENVNLQLWNSGSRDGAPTTLLLALPSGKLLHCIWVYTMRMDEISCRDWPCLVSTATLISRDQNCISYDNTTAALSKLRLRAQSLIQSCPDSHQYTQLGIYIRACIHIYYIIHYVYVYNICIIVFSVTVSLWLDDLVGHLQWTTWGNIHSLLCLVVLVMR